MKITWPATCFSIFPCRWSKLLLSGMMVVLLCLHAVTAHAGTPPFPVTQCAADRYGSKLNCTAADVKLNTITITGSAPASCVGGSNLFLDLDATVEFGTNSRYDIGVFLSNDGKDPGALISAGGASSCSVAVLPTVSPFMNLDFDACGDGVGITGTIRMNGVSLPCISASGSFYLNIPYVISWDNLASTYCGDNTYPVPGTSSKCNTGTVAFPPGLSIVVLPAISITDGVTIAKSGDTLTYTVAITNTTGSLLSNAVFTDPAVANLSVGSVSCIAAGGATCPASPTVSAMQGAGISLPPNMPINSSLTFTIVGTAGSPTSQTTLTNTANVTVGGQTNSASDIDTLYASPMVAKTFSPSAIAPGGTSTLTITLNNPNSIAVTGMAFIDNYPAGMANSSTLTLTNSCGGTATAAASGISLILSGGTIAAGSSCSVTVQVNASVSGVNSTGTVTTTNVGRRSAVSATLQVVSATNSTVVANPTSIVSDGVSTSTITVTLKDTAGNPVSGKTVTLTAGSGSSIISAASGPSNASGVVTFTVTDSVGEAVVYTARDTTDTITITQTAMVTYLAPSATRSTVVASPTSLPADGNTTSTITVTLLTSAGAPVSGKMVTLTAGSGNSTISAASGPSNASGVVTFTVKDLVAQTVVYTARDTTDSITMTQTATVIYGPSAANSTVVASPTSVPADGATTSTVTVTLKDGMGNPVWGKTVTLTAGSGSSIISAASGPSDASGVVTFTVTDLLAEAVIYTATDTTDTAIIPITQTATVIYGPSAANSTVVASPTSVPADGTTTSTVTVTLKDGMGNPVSGKKVTLTAGSGSSIISAASGPSNASGVVTFTVKNSVAEAVIYTATDTTDTAIIPITQTATVIFGPSAANSTVVASPISVPADGTTTSTVTVTLKDEVGNPVSGKTVTLTAGSGSSIISAASGPSDASGVVTFTVTDSEVEVVTYTAADTTDNITITQTATVTYTLLTRVVSINRNDPDPTSAATVSWTVTFNQSVTGLDASAFTLSASGVSGAFISVVTGSGITWTVTANTGIGSGTLGLNQSGPGSVVATLYGTFSGEVYTISSTPAMAEYRMDELIWDGTANEVVDSSGSGNHAQAFNSANTDNVSPVSIGTCRYGVFANDSTITKGYVQTPLPDLASDFTITAWIRTTNNTVTEQRILIDDEHNSAGYGFSLADSGTPGILRFYSRGITPINLDSTYTIADNTWYFVAAVADITNKKRTIYVFDAAGTFLNSTTEAAWTGGVWGTDAGPVSIGAEINASSEAPAGFHFHGNLDEVRVYQKILNQAALSAIATQTHSCAGVDHYEIIHDGSALTCAPEDVSIVACADTGCTTLLTTPATVALSPTGWVGGDTVTFTGSTHAQLIHTIPETVTLGMSGQMPLPLNGFRCVQTIGGPSVSCDMIYYESGFSFDIPTQTSCKESGDIVISAIGRDPDTNKCVPFFASRSEDVSFWSSYVNPNTGIEAVQVNDTAVAGASPGTPVSLNFDANGQSTFNVSYNDAGQVQLNARFLGAGSEVGLEMLGSDSFVAAPAGLCVYSDGSDSDCVSGDAGCSVFMAAGTSFALKVKGVCWQADGETNAQFCDNATTANFRMDSIALSHALVTPATGISGNSAISSANISAAGEVAVQQSVSEVGVFTFTADPPNDYLGTGDVFAGVTFTSVNIGRFTPHHFDVSIAPNPPAFADISTGFTYLGQPFNWATTPQLTIRAMNAANGITQNYEGSFWKLANPLASYTYADANVTGSALSLTPATSFQNLPDTSNCDGTVTFSLVEEDFNYIRPTMDFPVIPFVPAVSLSIAQARLTDTDNVCYDLGAGVGCQGVVVSGITGTHMRHGQVQIFNNFGPETADITNSPFEVQYYDGAKWVVNVDDNSTTGLIFCPSTRVSVIWPVPLASGKGTFTVSKPDFVTVCLTEPTWLTSATDCSTPDSSCGEFTFGIYRGNDRIINWQEIIR
jgi:hypothetical protein